MAGGRRGQKGLTRMDAALDHLCGVMGFPKVAIRKKINELLKEYGGPDGWVFIEETSYKLVIEEILKEKEGSEPNSPLLADAASQENMHGDSTSSSAAGPLNVLANPGLDMYPDVDKCEKHTPLEVRHAPPLSPPRQQKVNHAPPPPPPPPPEMEYVPPPPPPPPEMEPSLHRVRRPCYGWWGEETEVITLPEMPVRVKGA